MKKVSLQILMNLRKMSKHIKVNLRIEDVKSIIEVYELIKYQNRGPIEEDEKKTLNRIIRQLKKGLIKDEN